MPPKKRTGDTDSNLGSKKRKQEQDGSDSGEQTEQDSIATGGPENVEGGGDVMNESENVVSYVSFVCPVETVSCCSRHIIFKLKATKM